MKNISQKNKRTCLVFDIRELEEILSELFSDGVLINIYDGVFDVSFANYEPGVWYDEVIEKLNEYFDISISSIHVDGWDTPLVWIVYKC